VEVQRSYRRIGYWAALACGAGAVAYGLISTLVGVVASSALTWFGLSLLAFLVAAVLLSLHSRGLSHVASAPSGGLAA
jgi:hypothetical protein